MEDIVALDTVWDRTAHQVAEYEQQWIDPVDEDQDRTTFHRYPQPSRGTGGAEGSYQLYLPPTYETEPARRFPVVYWLHGGFGNARDGAPAVERIDRAIRSGEMQPVIVVVPHVLPVGWYVDSRDGERPLEQIVVRDLVAHIDGSYRTLADADARTVEGMSMGGYGALRLGLKHPDVFGRVSAIAPAVLRDMALEAPERVLGTFSGDDAYFAAVGPWTQLVANAPEVRRSSQIRILAGAEDARLVATLRDYSALMDDYGVPHSFVEVPGADHEFDRIVDGLGSSYTEFWAS